MARNRSTARVSRGTRSPSRKWVWVRNRGIGQTVAANGDIFRDLLATFETTYGADLLGMSVMRIRGQIKTDESVLWGVRVMTESTLNLLVSGTNGPRFDQNADWMLYQPLFVDGATGEEQAMDIDVKSSRRLEELGQGLLLAVSNESSAIATVSWSLSIGVKLP